MNITEIQKHQSEIEGILQNFPALRSDTEMLKMLSEKLMLHLIEFGVEMRILGREEVAEVLGRTIYSLYCRCHPA